MRRRVTGTRSIDQMVEAAIWLMVQGDRAGAEDLLVQALRIDPTHERARQAMKSIGAITRPGEKQPPQLSSQRTTSPGLPRDDAMTPLEPVPAIQRPAPPPAIPRSTLPSFGAVSADPWADRPGDSTLPGADHPYGHTTPAAERRDERTDRHVHPRPGGSTTQPRVDPGAVTITGDVPVLGKSWALEVLTGPHAGKSLTIGRRPMLVGRGLGVLDVEEDLFMSPAHASFFPRNGELWISDGGSASGSWVSVEGPTRLNPGDSFSVGLQRLRYLGPLDAAPEEQPSPYGAPRPASSWRLEHVLVGDRPGRTWLLRGVVTVGRDGNPVKFAEDESLAAVHAELRPAGASLELIDRGEPGKTFVMLIPGAERRLPEGTRVRLGSMVLRVAAR